MATINPRDITIQTECYAAVEAEMGFHCGKIVGWKLYSLENPKVYRTLSQRPSEVLAAFTTREELEQWLADMQKEPESELKKSPTLFDMLDDQPATEEVKPNTVGSGPNKLIISQIM